MNWDDTKTPISKYFTVGEALYLPSWRIFHIPSEAEKEEILKLASRMDIVREFIGLPLEVHCWTRPLIVNNPDSKYHGKNYNKYVGSKNPNGSHPKGRGIDYNVKGYETAEQNAKIRQLLLPKLEEWDLRMEDITGSWIHNDNLPVTSRRFFKP